MSQCIPSVASSSTTTASATSLTGCQADTNKLRLLVPSALRAPVRLTAGVRTHHIMKTIATPIILCFMATSAIANVTDSSAPHPLYGKWEWTYAKNNCTEVYDYRSDNTSVITSGEEQAESRFTISEKHDLNGFCRMKDVTTKSNGRTGCDGEPGGTPVGDTATMYIFFHPKKKEMVICQEPSFNACMGPLRRRLP